MLNTNMEINITVFLKLDLFYYLFVVSLNEEEGEGIG